MLAKLLLRRWQSTNAERKQLVIIGTGWAGYKMLVDCKKMVQKAPVDIIVISERNHFLYTPLLASTTVGTLEFRSIIETVRAGGHSFRDESHFHLASVTNVKEGKVECTSTLDDRKYEIPYDMLVIACGARPNTFGIPGVEEYAYYLKEIWHARRIRNKILENIERACQPGVSEEEKKQLLQIVVVGGGPTGVEFCAELYDFIKQDLVRIYPKLTQHLNVSLVESREILGMFDQKLKEFAKSKIESRPRMKIVKQNCVKISKDSITLSDDTVLPCGMVIWSAGVAAAPLTKALPFPKAKNGNLKTNAYCQIEAVEGKFTGLPSTSNVFAIGDCAEIEDYPLPATAQVAQSQAEYLVKLVNNKWKNPNQNHIEKYSFQGKGLMAYVGGYQGLVQVKDTKLSGWKAWFIWRSAYLTKLGSWRLRMQVPLDWLKTMIVGRDVSRF